MKLFKLPVLPSARVLVEVLTGLSTNEWHEHFDAVQKNLRFGGGRVVYGLSAERTDPLNRAYLKPGLLPDGSLFIETDRNRLTYRLELGVWKYVGGSYERTQSQLSALAATLGTGDAGLLVEVTDFCHLLKWSGSAWGWGPGEEGSGRIEAFAVDPNPTTGWQLCDGTASVTYLKADGTTGTYTVPDLTSAANKAAYLKLAGTVAGPTAAAAPTLTNPTVNNAATGATVDSAATGITSTGTPSATTVVQSGAGSTVASSAHTHAITDPNHTHNVTDPEHTHTLSGGSVAADGEPRHMDLKPWFRR